MSFFWVLQHIVKLNGKAVGIDPYRPHSRNRVSVGLQIAGELVEQNAAIVGLKNFKLIREPSTKALMEMNLNPTVEFDFSYIDGDHYGPTALQDMMLVWSLMADGGIMIVDDFNRQFLRGAKLVRPAAMAFFDVYSNQIEPLFMTQRQIGFIKRG